VGARNSGVDPVDVFATKVTLGALGLVDISKQEGSPRTNQALTVLFGIKMQECLPNPCRRRQAVALIALCLSFQAGLAQNSRG